MAFRVWLLGPLTKSENKQQLQPAIGFKSQGSPTTERLTPTGTGNQGTEGHQGGFCFLLRYATREVIQIYIYIYIYIYVCMHACMYVGMYVCMQIVIYTQTIRKYRLSAKCMQLYHITSYDSYHIIWLISYHIILYYINIIYACSQGHTYNVPVRI